MCQYSRHPSCQAFALLDSCASPDEIPFSLMMARKPFIEPHASARDYMFSRFVVSGPGMYDIRSGADLAAHIIRESGDNLDYIRLHVMTHAFPEMPPDIDGPACRIFLRLSPFLLPPPSLPSWGCEGKSRGERCGSELGGRRTKEEDTRWCDVAAPPQGRRGFDIGKFLATGVRSWLGTVKLGSPLRLP
eukprot:3697289-Pyramimonas_sp.AAC.1